MNYTIAKLQDVDAPLCQQLRSYCFDIIGCCQAVHQEMGPFLNEYMYQDALDILLDERNIQRQKEYYFSLMFHGKRISHKHYVDFFVKDNVFVECKAVTALCPDHRQQLWNYMRLTGVSIGILYNFAPVRDQCERYYLDSDKGVMYTF